MPYPNNLPALTPRGPSGEFNRFPNTRLSVFAERRARIVTSVLRKPVLSVVALPAEPEDAHLTGATRSLERRLLALNIRQVS